ncbi:MAG: exodeoxyribonuclease VII large subunit [Eubacterium sp.]|nr:exodeoxyribonuclease VII large subunit [Eubacterium sp.]
MKNNVYTVGQVNTYLNKLLKNDFFLQKIYIKGEVSNCKYHGSGHIYFTIKDETGCISAVMFRGNRSGLKFDMKDGDMVVCMGSVEVYAGAGKYQLYAKEITLDGAGDLFLEYERLKKELLERGMFDQMYKKSIPLYSQKIGVVTAPTGAAVQDIRNITARRNPYAQLVLYPALVQGEGAIESVVKGIRTLDAYGVDVIIAGRGGGSIEDLWAFNSIEVAEAIFNSQTPVISAVGHETDTTIADYVADLRAPTPSAAAELAVCDIRQITGQIDDYFKRYETLMQRKADIKRRSLENLYLRLKSLSPESRLNEKKQRAADLERRLFDLMERRLRDSKTKLELYAGRLEGVSPLKHLSSGYTYVTDENGKNLRSTEGIKEGESVNLRFIDGVALAEIKKVTKEEIKNG